MFDLEGVSKVIV